MNKFKMIFAFIVLSVNFIMVFMKVKEMNKMKGQGVISLLGQMVLMCIHGGVIAIMYDYMILLDERG